ncbi:MAG: hypothetical protein KKC05_03930 [Nanoarchaeota archaeon]|nr:hypothetical protein [Nanoarchaeota archaeon]
MSQGYFRQYVPRTPGTKIMVFVTENKMFRAQIKEPEKPMHDMIVGSREWVFCECRKHGGVILKKIDHIMRSLLVEQGRVKKQGVPKTPVYIVVFVTKGMRFRAKIEEPGNPTYEVSVGGHEWTQEGKGREYEGIIFDRIAFIMTCLVAEQRRINLLLGSQIRKRKVSNGQ